jgi:hypothetical protein
VIGVAFPAHSAATPLPPHPRSEESRISLAIFQLPVVLASCMRLLRKLFLINQGIFEKTNYAEYVLLISARVEDAFTTFPLFIIDTHDAEPFPITQHLVSIGDMKNEKSLDHQWPPGVGNLVHSWSNRLCTYRGQLPLQLG